MSTCPVADIAKLPFTPDPGIRRMSPAARFDRVDEMGTEVWTAAKVAIEIGAMTKPELIAAVHANVEQYGPHLQWFARAK